MPLGGEIRCIRMWLCLFFTWISLLESLGICCIKDIYENIALGYSLKGSNVGQGQMKGRQAGDSGHRECWESSRPEYSFWSIALKQNIRASNIQQSHFHFRGFFFVFQFLNVDNFSKSKARAGLITQRMDSVYAVVRAWPHLIWRAGSSSTWLIYLTSGVKQISVIWTLELLCSFNFHALKGRIGQENGNSIWEVCHSSSSACLRLDFPWVIGSKNDEASIKRGE